MSDDLVVVVWGWLAVFAAIALGVSVWRLVGWLRNADHKRQRRNRKEREALARVFERRP